MQLVAVKYKPVKFKIHATPDIFVIMHKIYYSFLILITLHSNSILYGYGNRFLCWKYIRCLHQNKDLILEGNANIINRSDIIRSVVK